MCVCILRSARDGIFSNNFLNFVFLLVFFLVKQAYNCFMKKQLYIHSKLAVSTLAVITLMMTLAPTAFAEDTQGGVNGDAHVSASAQMSPQGGFGGIFQNIKTGLREGIQVFHGPKPTTTPSVFDRPGMMSGTSTDKGDGKGDGEEEGNRGRNGFMMSTTTRMHILEDVRMVMMFKIDTLRINATINRLQKIVTKLNARIAKIALGGANVTVAQNSSAQATAALTLATTDMTNVKNIVASISMSTPFTSTATSTIKTDMTDAQMQIKTAQKDIEDAVKSLMPLQADIDAHATSSVEHDTNNQR
jgi:hypothetical protein